MKRPAKIRKLLQAASSLPADQARRIVSAIVAKDAPVDPDAKDLQAIRDAVAADLRPIADAMWKAYQEGDIVAVQAALKKIIAQGEIPVGKNLAKTLSAAAERTWLHP